MIVYWWCLLCSETGEGDRKAEKHTKDTHHPTMTSIHPKPARFHGGNEVVSE